MSYPMVGVREHIAAGPRFSPVGGANAQPAWGCLACAAGDVVVDELTGLCLDCWRVWRWSAKREEGRPGAPPVLVEPAAPAVDPGADILGKTDHDGTRRCDCDTCLAAFPARALGVVRVTEKP